MSDPATGCPSAWHCPSMATWRSHVDAGEWSLAAQAIADDQSPTAREARDLLTRLRHEWSLSEEAMFDRLVAAMGSVTREEMDAWTASGALESRVIDGHRRYFRREPRNLFLFDAEARHRKERHEGKPLKADRHDSTSPIVPHLVEVIAAADASPGVGELLAVRTRFHYSLIVKPDRPGAQKGSVVRAWLPFPQHYRQQRDVRLIESFPRTNRISPAGSAHRTIYFEQKVRDPLKPIRFDVSFEYTTRALSWHERPAHDSTSDLQAARPHYVAERPPHIVFTDEVRAIVRELSIDTPDPRTLAKRLWNWVDDHIPWRAEHEYCLIGSIIEQSLRLRRGDCGVATLTLITLCRFAGIPARWQSGWTTDPHTGGNMHDWCEVFLDGCWMPVDPSYGKKSHPDERVRDFYFGGLDRYRLIVNTDYGAPLVPAKASLRSEPLDFQRGEVELDGRNLYFDEWDYSFRFEHADLASPQSSS